MCRHNLPNIITVIIVNATLDFATCMLTEASLSFIGFGVSEPNATWGNMLNGAQNGQVIENYWWRWVFPSLALGICTISINCVGDGLRDAIDPALPLGLGNIPYGPQQVMFLQADITQLAADTGFAPRTAFADGIRATIAWAKTQKQTN